MKRILVIEDFHPLRQDIAEILSLEGFETLQAVNGAVGIRMAEREIPDLILCDIRMPELDGFGVLQLLRANPKIASIPFIFLTAHTDKDSQRAGMAHGADDYLTKPFTADELIAAVNSRLQRNEAMRFEGEKRLNLLRQSIVLALPHEMRTPLNAILGFTEIIMTDVETLNKTQIEDMAGHVNRSANRLYRLLENYILYANLEILKSDVERQANLRRFAQPTQPQTLLHQLAENQSKERHRQGDLVFDLPADLPWIQIDEENLTKLYQELLDNAFKFSREGQPVKITVTANTEWLTLHVEDRGVGMKADSIQSVGAYMQFERNHIEQQGLGLGLTIALRLTEIYGGKLTIRSEPGKFTKVTVELPVSKQKPLTNASPTR